MSSSPRWEVCHLCKHVYQGPTCIRCKYSPSFTTNLPPSSPSTNTKQPTTSTTSPVVFSGYRASTSPRKSGGGIISSSPNSATRRSAGGPSTSGGDSLLHQQYSISQVLNVVRSALGLLPNAVTSRDVDFSDFIHYGKFVRELQEQVGLLRSQNLKLREENEEMKADVAVANALSPRSRKKEETRKFQEQVQSALLPPERRSTSPSNQSSAVQYLSPLAKAQRAFNDVESRLQSSLVASKYIVQLHETVELGEAPEMFISKRNENGAVVADTIGAEEAEQLRGRIEHLEHSHQDMHRETEYLAKQLETSRNNETQLRNALSKAEKDILSMVPSIGQHAATKYVDAQAYETEIQSLQDEIVRLRKELAASQTYVSPSRRIPPTPEQQQQQQQTSTSAQKNTIMALSVSARQKLKSRVVRFYERYNPSKASEVDQIMDMYDGDEKSLMEALVLRYGPEPTE